MGSANGSEFQQLRPSGRIKRWSWVCRLEESSRMLEWNWKEWPTMLGGDRKVDHENDGHLIYMYGVGTKRGSTFKHNSSSCRIFFLFFNGNWQVGSITKPLFNWTKASFSWLKILEILPLYSNPYSIGSKALFIGW